MMATYWLHVRLRGNGGGVVLLLYHMLLMLMLLLLLIGLLLVRPLPWGLRSKS